jgi:Helix-turn-helix domain
MGSEAAPEPTGLQLAQALSHPVRHRLLLQYHRAATSPSRAARLLEAPLNVVSYHTRVLLNHRCIEEVDRRRVRGAVERFYRATRDPIIEDEEWAALPRRLRRAMTLNTLAMMHSEARQGAINGGFDDPCTHMSRTPLDLDEQGRTELNGLLRTLMDDAIRIQSESVARRPRSTSPVELVMLHFRRASSP